MTQEKLGDEVAQIRAAWARERPGVDVSSIAIVTPLWRLASRLEAARKAALAPYDLDQSALDVLGTLRRSGPPYRLTVGELTLRTRVTTGATTQRVSRLEDAGFVRRVREKPDRRTVYVELTPRGSERLDEIFADVIAADEAVLAPLGPADRETLERILRDWLRAADLDRSSPPK